MFLRRRAHSRGQRFNESLYSAEKEQRRGLGVAVSGGDFSAGRRDRSK